MAAYGLLLLALLSLFSPIVAYSFALNDIEDTKHVFFVLDSSEKFALIRSVFVAEVDDVIVLPHTNASEPEVIHYAPVPVNLECLLAAPAKAERERSIWNGEDDMDEEEDMDELLVWVNKKANTFRDATGQLDKFGIKRLELERGMYRSGGDTSSGSRVACDEISRSSPTFQQEFLSYYLKQQPFIIKNFLPSGVDSQLLYNILVQSHGHKTVGVKYSDTKEFEGIESVESFVKKYNEANVAIPTYMGEGENGTISTFKTAPTFDVQTLMDDIPVAIRANFSSMEYLVVRAAHRDITISEYFKELLEQQNRIREDRKGNTEEWRAYIEYQNLEHFPELVSSLFSKVISSSNQKMNHTAIIDFLDDTAFDEAPYLWLGSDTISKLHYDPYDNLLLQLEGSKTFIMIESNTEQGARMKEGHLREAQLGIRRKRQKNTSFSSAIQKSDRKRKSRDKTKPMFMQVEKEFEVYRESVSDFTSIVHSPVSILEYEADGQRSIECRVDSGSMLFVPSYYWHEVISETGSDGVNTQPDEDDGMRVHFNAAINFWYPPLFHKLFPCALCEKSLNPSLRDYFSKIVK